MFLSKLLGIHTNQISHENSSDYVYPTTLHIRDMEYSDVRLFTREGEIFNKNVINKFVEEQKSFIPIFISLVSIHIDSLSMMFSMNLGMSVFNQFNESGISKLGKRDTLAIQEFKLFFEK